MTDRVFRWFVLFAAVAVAVTIAGIAAAARDAPRGAGGRLGPGLLNGMGPIGRSATESTDVDSTTFTGLPFVPLLPANDGGAMSIVRVWVRTDEQPAMAVELESGVVIMERLAEAIDYPTDAYYRAFADGVPGASVVELNGAPAMVIQGSEELGNPSSVDVILQGIHLSVIGGIAQPSDELVALVTDIAATGAGSPAPSA
jgi:hypothetical protein